MGVLVYTIYRKKVESMKSNYIVRAQKFMESFYPYMRQYHSITVAVSKYNERYSRAVKVREGAVRRVLLTSDYVIKWDYDKGNSRCFGGCREEYKIYQEVKDSYYGYLFAEITPIKIKNRVFYVMPRVKKLGIDCGQEIGDVLETDELDYIYDEMQLGDIHEENWGYLKGQAVLIDYACQMT